MMKEVTIIAEAGVNHNGNYEQAIQLVNAAKNAGAKIVKFQYFQPQRLVIPNAKKANYQSQNTKLGDTETQQSMLEKLCLTDDEHAKIAAYCVEQGIEYLCTPFSKEDLDSIIHLISKIKIPSGEATNIPFLEYACTFGKPIILSTGMCTLCEIINSVEAMVVKCQKEEIACPKITVLHCNTAYPTPMIDVNLNAMKTILTTLQNIFPDIDIDVGYSDHTLGIEVSLAAVALGACVIEKHFTLDRMLDGPDHLASIEPHELKMMIDSIANITLALGDGRKVPQLSEMENISVARKSWYYTQNLSKGMILSLDKIDLFRPGTGLPAKEIHNLIGRTLGKDVSKFDLVQFQDLL